MSSTVSIILIAVIIIAPWLVLFLYISNVNKKILKNYKVLSEKYGFSPDLSQKAGMMSHPVTSGLFGEHTVTVGSYIRGSGRRKYPSTFVKTACPYREGFNFLIVKRSKLNNVLYGNIKMKTGDSEFDDKFIVNTNNPALMNSLLNFSIKNKLIQTQNLGFKGEVSLENDALQYTEPELIHSDTNLLRVELMLHLLSEIADELSNKHKAVIGNA